MIALQFSSMRDPASEAIKLFQRGWPSHCDAILPDGTLLGARNDAIGGVPAGVQIRPPAYSPFDRVLAVRLAAPPPVEDAFLAFVRAQVGKPYDNLAILAFAIERDWREEGSYFCSELLALALEKCGWFPAPLAVVANEVTPRDLLLAVSPWAELVA